MGDSAFVGVSTAKSKCSFHVCVKTCLTDMLCVSKAFGAAGAHIHEDAFKCCPITVG